jgi:hypothetical protein
MENSKENLRKKKSDIQPARTQKYSWIGSVTRDARKLLGTPA